MQKIKAREILAKGKPYRVITFGFQIFAGFSIAFLFNMNSKVLFSIICIFLTTLVAKVFPFLSLMLLPPLGIIVLDGWNHRICWVCWARQLRVWLFAVVPLASLCAPFCGISMFSMTTMVTICGMVHSAQSLRWQSNAWTDSSAVHSHYRFKHPYVSAKLVDQFIVLMELPRSPRVRS